MEDWQDIDFSPPDTTAQRIYNEINICRRVFLPNAVATYQAQRGIYSAEHMADSMFSTVYNLLNGLQLCIALVASLQEIADLQLQIEELKGNG